MIFLILNNVFSTRFSRFTTPDPAANQYPSISPYAYCAANLLRYSDPTGMFITANDEDDRKYVFDPEEGIFTDFLGNTSDNFFIEELTTALSEICSTNWRQRVHRRIQRHGLQACMVKGIYPTRQCVEGDWPRQCFNSVPLELQRQISRGANRQCHHKRSGICHRDANLHARKLRKSKF